jgi:hypothetical protein
MDYWDYFWLGADKNVTFSNITNGTYCFNVCPFNTYNTTYYWNVSVDDGITVEDFGPYSFTTVPDPSLCPSGYDEIVDLIHDTDTVRDDSWLIGLIIVFFVLAMVMAKKRRK